MGRQIPKWTLIKVGIVDRDPELRLGTAREAGKPMDNPTTDESRENETSRGEGYRNPQGPYPDTTSRSRTHQDLNPNMDPKASFLCPEPAPTMASPAQGRRLLPWAPQQQ